MSKLYVGHAPTLRARIRCVYTVVYPSVLLPLRLPGLACEIESFYNRVTYFITLYRLVAGCSIHAQLFAGMNFRPCSRSPLKNDRPVILVMWRKVMRIVLLRVTFIHCTELETTFAIFQQILTNIMRTQMSRRRRYDIDQGTHTCICNHIKKTIQNIYRWGSLIEINVFRVVLSY